MKLDIDSTKYRIEDLEKLMKDKAKKKRNRDTIDLINLKKEAEQIQKQIKEKEENCTHPRRYLKLECTSYYGSDGYGGSEYCNGRYSLVCKLCGKWDIVQVKDNSRG